MDENIPGYTVISRIGEGGMATVYLAYQQNLERRVALKILPSEQAVNPAVSERFMREMKIGANLLHRNIVPVYEGGRYKTSHYLVMEYLPNGNFKRRIENGCDTTVTLRVIYDVACALAYVHSKSYIHRDVKPENILFREDKSAVLTDFGIALDTRSNIRGKPASRLILGSPQYMSPEQARGDALDYRSDIYSLGAVLYEALAGHPLFESPATVADAVRHSKEPVPLLPASVSWLQPLLEKMLAKDRNERFGSMDEVIEALEPCLAVPSFGWGIQPAAYLKNLGKNGPNVSPSAPTLIEDIPHEEESAPVKAPPKEPAAAVAPQIQHTPQPGTGRKSNTMTSILVLALILVALALVYRNRFSLTAPPASSTEDSAVKPAVTSPETTAKPETDSGTRLNTVATTAAPAQAASPATSTDSGSDTSAEAVATEKVTIAKPQPATETKTASQPAPANPTPSPMQPAPSLVDNRPQQSPQAAPTSVSAYDKYRDILSQDPHNQAALEGLLMVAIRYLDLSSKELNDDNLDSAQRYLDQASTIASDYHLGSGIGERIANQQYMVNRIRYLDNHKDSPRQADAGR